MQHSLLNCENCGSHFPTELHNSDSLRKCPFCGVSVMTVIFPALFRDDRSGQKGEKLLIDDEASCFYHPSKKAVVPCEACGRFLCALCDVEFNEKHMCAICIEAGGRKKRIKDLENHRVLYDNMALAVALLPLLTCWGTILSAPITMYIVIRYWYAPLSILPRTNIRFVLAAAIAMLEILGWVGVFSGYYRFL